VVKYSIKYSLNIMILTVGILSMFPLYIFIIKLYIILIIK